MFEEKEEGLLVCVWLRPLCLTGIHRDAEKETVIMEAAGAEACTLVSTETSAGHDWIPSAEEVLCAFTFIKRSSVFISSFMYQPIYWKLEGTSSNWLTILVFGITLHSFKDEA